MLLQLPRLTSSLCDPFDVDQAYLHRKTILQGLKPRSSASSSEESELARNIVYKWDEASPELRQAYKQFIGSVRELVGGEVVQDEFREVALSVYRHFSGPMPEGEEDCIISEKK
nr:DExH-box ATP-dependent RNA helicase DExH14 isoform X1 [Ipomoea batatas]